MQSWTRLDWQTDHTMYQTRHLTQTTPDPSHPHPSAGGHADPAHSRSKRQGEQIINGTLQMINCDRLRGDYSWKHVKVEGELDNAPRVTLETSLEAWQAARPSGEARDGSQNRQEMTQTGGNKVQEVLNDTRYLLTEQSEVPCAKSLLYKDSDCRKKTKQNNFQV